MVYTDHHLRQLARYLSYDNCPKSWYSFNQVNILKCDIESSCFQSLSDKYVPWAYKHTDSFISSLILWGLSFEPSVTDRQIAQYPRAYCWCTPQQAHVPHCCHNNPRLCPWIFGWIPQHLHSHFVWCYYKDWQVLSSHLPGRTYCRNCLPSHPKSW